MGGHVRENEDEHVFEACLRLRQDIWWIIVYFEDNEMKYNYFRSSAKENLKALKQSLQKIVKEEKPHIILAVWHGKNRTDTFLIKTNKLLEFLEGVA